jgi:hypothetical protein
MHATADVIIGDAAKGGVCAVQGLPEAVAIDAKARKGA